MDSTWKTRFRDHWLTLLIAAQPLLDALAFWTANERGTAAGYIRLLIMAALPLYLLIRGRERKKLLLAFGVMAIFALLHVGNNFRVGVIAPVFDLSYLVKVLQMPVLAVCFLFLIRDEQTKEQAFRGIAIAGGITLAFYVLAWLTGTGNVTYGEGLGYSGWVIDDNRTANSILFVTLGSFAVARAVKGESKLWQALVPCAVTAVYLCNGTKACYFSLYGIFAAYAVYALLRRPVRGEKVRAFAALVLALLMGFATVIYPYTPRAKVSASIAQAAEPGEIEAALLERGIDVTPMSFEERFAHPVVREVFYEYYLSYFDYVIPDLFPRFGTDRIFTYWRMTTDVDRLIDTRQIKICYSALVWEDCDLLTRLVGFEVSELGFDGIRDLENDWPALYFYYGYLGCALYGGFILYFVLRVLRRLREDFQGSFTAENYALLFTLLLLLGLAQFSGALLRRPNVNIYLALILALIAYATRREEARP